MWLKTDVRQDVVVHWRPRGSTGNQAADRLARAAVAKLPGEARQAAAAARTAEFASRLGRFYARLLDLALSADRLPKPDALGQLFRLPRPPRLPAHAVAVDGTGAVRCNRCLLPAGMLKARLCRPAGTLGHRMQAVGAGLVCTSCGAYSFRHVLHLGTTCRGRLADPAAGWRLRRMLDGRHPVTGQVIGTAVPIDPVDDAFHVILGF